MAVTGGCLREARKLQWGAILVQVPQTLEVAVPGGDARCPRGPCTTVHVRVFQTLEVAVPGGLLASQLIPRTAFRVRVCQTLEMVIACGVLASILTLNPKPGSLLPFTFFLLPFTIFSGFQIFLFVFVSLRCMPVKQIYGTRNTRNTE
jgi:hypothetical protein